MVLVLRIFKVSIGGKSSDEFTPTPFCVKSSSDIVRSLASKAVIHKPADRNLHSANYLRVGKSIYFRVS